MSCTTSITANGRRIIPDPPPGPRQGPAFATCDVVSLPVGTDVDYQLGGDRSAPARAGIVVRDREAAPAGRYDVCYVNAFQTQPDVRSWWRACGFDFVVAEECGRWRECDPCTHGRRVLAVEYRRVDFAWTCRRFGDALPVVLRDLAVSPHGVRQWC